MWKYGKTYKVLGIQDEAFKNNLNITSLYIYSGLVSIGKSAFEGCKNLKTITFANSVKVIEDAAFKNGTKLTNVTLPNKLVSIGNEAFYNVSLI